MDHVSENKPLRELAFALVGVLLFVGIVLLIGVSAFLRPAGEHVVAAPEAVVEDVAEPTNPTNQPNVPSETSTVEDPIIVDAPEADSDALGRIETPADSDITPAVLPESGTAMLGGAASQTAPEIFESNSIASAELTDGDLVADTDVVVVDEADVVVTVPAQ